MRCSTLFAILVISFSQIGLTSGQSGSLLPPSLATRVNDDVLAVGFIDFQSSRENASPHGIRDGIMSPLKAFLANGLSIPNVDVKRVYWLHNVEDFVAIPTLFVQVATQSATQNESSKPFKLNDRLSPLTHGLATGGGYLLGTERAVQSRQASTLTPRPDLTVPFQELSKSRIGFVVSPGKSTRRVLRESFPDLPPPFELITGKLLANDIKSVQLSVDSNDVPTLEMDLQGSPDEASLIIEKCIGDGLAVLEQSNATSPMHEMAKKLGSAIGLMKRSRSRSTVTLLVPDETASKFNGLLASAVSTFVAQRATAQRMNDVRQVMLAIANYESSSGHFPGSYSVDASGKPLLSWRVHVLPYLDEMELYDEFDLTKPWDSPQNMKLIERMPNVFQHGKKTSHARLLGVAGTECFLDGAKNRQVKEMRDGVSKTAGVAYVTDEVSVVWTKPGDWNANLSDPYRGLAQDTDGRIYVGLLDAVVVRLRHGFNPEMFATVLTINGGETTFFKDL